MAEPDYFKVLGVARDASDEEIRKRYRALARQYHPDHNPGDKMAEEQFKEISTAYEKLEDQDAVKKQRERLEREEEREEQSEQAKRANEAKARKREERAASDQAANTFEEELRKGKRRNGFVRNQTFRYRPGESYEAPSQGVAAKPAKLSLRDACLRLLGAIAFTACPFLFAVLVAPVANNHQGDLLVDGVVLVVGIGLLAWLLCGLGLVVTALRRLGKSIVAAIA